MSADLHTLDCPNCQQRISVPCAFDLPALEVLSQVPVQQIDPAIPMDGVRREYRIYQPSGERVTGQWRRGWNDALAAVEARALAATT